MHDHKYGSTYSRTEPESAKTPPQELSPARRCTSFELIFVFSMSFIPCIPKTGSKKSCMRKLWLSEYPSFVSFL